MKAVLGIGAISICSVILLTLYFTYMRQKIVIRPATVSTDLASETIKDSSECVCGTIDTANNYVIPSSSMPKPYDSQCKPCKCGTTGTANNYVIPSLSMAYDSECKPCQNENGIHLITNFFPVTHPRWRAGISNDDEKSEAENKEIFERRLQELEDVLQKNLNHRLVAAVYVLYDHPYVFVLLTKLSFENKNKLVLHKVDKDPTYRHAMDYANTYLMGKIVVFTNQDIYLGEGWELLDLAKMRDKKIMYALSRHGQQERYCKMWSTCDYKLGYIGSHDTYAFVLRDKLIEEGLKELDHQSDNYGVENVLIWAFQTKFKFKVLNPCFKLVTYHVHCAKNTHNKVRPRISEGKIGLADFTELLE